MGRSADLTGKWFGKLTVIEKTGGQEDCYWTWRCFCDCGNEVIVNTKRLTRSTISHCGCEKKNAAALGPVPEKLTENRYGRLTVLRLDKQLRPGYISKKLCMIASSKHIRLGRIRQRQISPGRRTIPSISMQKKWKRFSY